MNGHSPVENGGGMTADLGLFNQLLQMVDGDWSDSIKGICTYLLERFEAICAVLVIYDRNYREYIYASHAITPACRELLCSHSMEFDETIILETLRSIEGSGYDVFSGGNFNGEDINRFVGANFSGNPDGARAFINSSGVNAALAIPIGTLNRNFYTVFYLVSGTELAPGDRALVHEYLKQLDIALEIIYLVRELYIKATHDGLTRLFNHKQGMILLSREFDRAKRKGVPLVAGMLDIDRFKNVNDTWGHESGNAVLEYTGELLSSRMRSSDIVSRYGGEEFLVVLPDTTLQAAVEVMKRLKDVFQQHPFVFLCQEVHVTFSMGLVGFDPSRHCEPMALVKEADRLLYLAKEGGRNEIRSG